MKLFLPVSFLVVSISTTTLLPSAVRGDVADCLNGETCDRDGGNDNGCPFYKIEESSDEVTTCEYTCKKPKSSSKGSGSSSSKTPKSTSSPRSSRRQRGLLKRRDDIDDIKRDLSSSSKSGKGYIEGCAPFDCENADEPEFSACDNEYRRVLSHFTASDESDMKLFELMVGEERHRHLQKHDSKKVDINTLGRCEYPGSYYDGRISTHDECLNPANQRNNKNGGEMPSNPFLLKDEQSNKNVVEPWAVPILEETSNVVTLANDPGIWSLDFLDEQETDQLIELIHKYGDELNLFGPCNQGVLTPSNAHPYESKKCFKISTEHACEGPYAVSECDVDTQPEDGILVDRIISKFKTMWSSSAGSDTIEPSPYVKVHRTEGDTAPMHLHTDVGKSISFVLYLSDGGANLLFPNANVTVIPKKGRAVAWLNMDRDGKRNPKSDHAVQAHPASAGQRLVMLMTMGRDAIDILSQ